MAKLGQPKLMQPGRVENQFNANFGLEFCWVFYRIIKIEMTTSQDQRDVANNTRKHCMHNAWWIRCKIYPFRFNPLLDARTENSDTNYGVRVYSTVCNLQGVTGVLNNVVQIFSWLELDNTRTMCSTMPHLVFKIPGPIHAQNWKNNFALSCGAPNKPRSIACLQCSSK